MRSSKVFLFAVVLLLVGGVASADGDLANPAIFASGEDYVDDVRYTQIGVVDLETDTSMILVQEPLSQGYSFEDVVVGPGPASPGGSSPPVYVYVCDPTKGLIFRFDPAWAGQGPIGVDDARVEVVYQGALQGGSGNNLSPQCGWFTSRGDLVFTDRDFEGAWICQGVGFAAPAAPDNSGAPLCQLDINLFPLGDAAFAGGGITQAANGDALAVDTNVPGDQGKILRFDIDGPTGTFPDDSPTPLSLVDQQGVQLFLDDPLGIARLSSGEIFATGDVLPYLPGGGESLPTGGYAVNRFVGRLLDDGTKQWELACQIVLSDDSCSGARADAYFLEAAADDTVYVAASYDDSSCGGSIWKIPADPPEVFADNPDDPYCTAQRVFGYEPPPGGSDAFDWLPDTLVGLGVSATAAEPASLGSWPNYEIHFNDHVYELDLPDSCVLYESMVLAQETPKSCLDNIISNYVFYDPDGDGQADEFVALPVLYLGEKAHGIAYDLDGECTAAGEITHAVSAFTKTVNNPRIIRCPDDGDLGIDDLCDPPVPSARICEVIELDSFFPGAGVLPEDGRISGTTRTSDFSTFFAVEAGPAGYQPATNPATAGESCGFFPPFAGIDELECFQCGPPKYLAGFPVTARFRAKQDGGSCLWGPFVSDTDVLASVARVRDEDGNPVFEEMDLFCLSPGCDDRPLFRRPWRPWLPYLIRFSTWHWEAGIYQIVATDLEGGVPSFYDYFEIVNWCGDGTEGGC